MYVCVARLNNHQQLSHKTYLEQIFDHYKQALSSTGLAGNGELLLIKYRPIIMVGLWCYNQSGVTELLIMGDPHYDRMCFKSVETPGVLHS